MSKINAARLININYNNNAIRISDEIFHFSSLARELCGAYSNSLDKWQL